MRSNPTRSAFIIIDMENGFISPESAHCIAGARATVPACGRALEAARKKGIPVFFVKRIYRGDGSDVELTRYEGWQSGGRAMRPASRGLNGADVPEELRPQPGDYTIIKPRWSAFFGTELDLILRRLGVRTTCYDANALDYNVVLVEDCCSSQTEDIQRANIADMARMGALIMSESEFESYDETTVEDMAEVIREREARNGFMPEPFDEHSAGWPDLW